MICGPPQRGTMAAVHVCTGSESQFVHWGTASLPCPCLRQQPSVFVLLDLCVQGRLTQLAAASVGMVCPNGLPADLSGLSALQTLDLAFNSLNSTTDRLAQVSMRTQKMCYGHVPWPPCMVHSHKIKFAGSLAAGHSRQYWCTHLTNQAAFGPSHACCSPAA
jgi:hypothetical protein